MKSVFAIQKRNSDHVPLVGAQAFPLLISFPPFPSFLFFLLLFLRDWIMGKTLSPFGKESPMQKQYSTLTIWLFLLAWQMPIVQINLPEVFLHCKVTEIPVILYAFNITKQWISHINCYPSTHLAKSSDMVAKINSKG